MKEKSLLLEIIKRSALKLLCVLFLALLWNKLGENIWRFDFIDFILPMISVFLLTLSWFRYRAHEKPIVYFVDSSELLRRISRGENRDPLLSKVVSDGQRNFNSDDIWYLSRQWSDIICAVLCILPYLIQTFL